MSRRFLAWLAAVTCGGLFLTAALVGLKVVTAPRAQGQEAAGKDLFGLTKVWAMHLEVPAKEYEAMQPAGGGFGFPGGPKGPPAPKDKKDPRDSEPNLFGVALPWAQAEFTADDKASKKVGLRYAGDMTYFA